MKWILTILLLISAGVSAQVGLRDDSTKYIRYQNQYGSRMPRFWADSAFHLPFFDTAIVKPQKAGAMMMHLDKNIYKWNGGGWESTGGTPQRFGLEDNSATANRTFNANGYNFSIDSVGNYNMYSKAKTTGADRGVITNFGFNTNNSINLWSYIPGSSTRSYGFNAYGALTQMFNAGHIPGHATYVQTDTIQVILEADPYRLYLFHDSLFFGRIDGGIADIRIRTLPQTTDTAYPSVVSGPKGQLFLRPGGNSGSTPGGSDIAVNVFKDSSFVPLIIISGESNAEGIGTNSCAASGELDVDPRVQIMQPSGAFADLNIGSNNNLTSSGGHGLELEIQNLIATKFGNRTVYIVKAGVSGSAISQWLPGTANYDTLTTRLNNAIARLNEANKIPVICHWYSQGINDVVAGTNATTWQTQTLSLFNSLWAVYGKYPVLMTQLIGDRVTYPAFYTYDNKIRELALNKDNYIYMIPTPQGATGASCTDSISSGGIHWQYLGLKAIADRMAAAMVDSAGYINYDRRIKAVAVNKWGINGNSNTSAATNFIGTIDNNALVFKTNNTEAFRIGTNQRVGIGTTTPGRLLDVNGDATINGWPIGKGTGNLTNLVFGNNIPNNTTGDGNIAIGGSALQGNTTGLFNIGLGPAALNANASGIGNIAIGFQTGLNTTGGFNNIIGTQTGGTWLTSQSNITAIHNGATGAWLWGDMSTGQVQINAASTPSLTASAALEVISTGRGFLMPRLTTSQRTGISSPATGLQVYDTDSNKVYTHDGTLWASQQLSLRGRVNWTPGVVGAGSSTTTTVTVTGAVTGDGVVVTKLSGYSNGEIYDAFVSSPNTVTIRVHNVSTGSANYSSAADYNVIVLKY